MPIRKRVSYVGYKDFQYRIIDTDAISANYFNVVHFPESEELILNQTSTVQVFWSPMLDIVPY
jgi:hypothetical protein